MKTRTTSPYAPLLGAVLAAVLALPHAASGQVDSARGAPPPPAGAAVSALPTSGASPQPGPTRAHGGRVGRARAAPSTAPNTRREEQGRPRTGGDTERHATTGDAAAALSASPPATSDTASAAAAAAAKTASAPRAAGLVERAPSASGTTAAGGLSWLAGSIAAASALLLVGEAGVIALVLLRIDTETRTIGTRLSIRDTQMTTQPAGSDSGPAVPSSIGVTSEPGLTSSVPESARDAEAAADAEPSPYPEAAPTAALNTAPEPELQPGADDARGQEPPPEPAAVPAPDGALDRDPARIMAPSASPANEALYTRARARLVELQEERGVKDRARLSAAAARFERRKGWVLALHDAWENDVDFAYLGVLQKPGAGAVKDPYVLVYPLNEHDWEASREGLRLLARHIDALPEAGDPHWPALLPLTALRSSVDFDLRVQPPENASPAAAFHARRVLAALLVNLKTLRRAQAELGRLVQWVVEAAPAAEARLADVSPQALAILHAVCGPGLSDEEREAGVSAAIAALDAADSGNFDAVRAAEDRADKLEQRYHAFLKVLFRAVDGIDRARALHAAALENGAGREAWLAAWGAILEELDQLLVRRVLGERLEVAPITCGRGDALDTDLHNPLGAERVPGVESDQVWRVESRGFAYAEDGLRRVVRPVDVIVAVPEA